jgi:hypothetical protein
MVVHSTVATTTNAEGRFTLRPAPTGIVEARVLHVGFQEQKKPAPFCRRRRDARFRDDSGQSCAGKTLASAEHDGMAPSIKEGALGRT